MFGTACTYQKNKMYTRVDAQLQAGPSQNASGTVKTSRTLDTAPHDRSRSSQRHLHAQSRTVPCPSRIERIGSASEHCTSAETSNKRPPTVRTPCALQRHTRVTVRSRARLPDAAHTSLDTKARHNGPSASTGSWPAATHDTEHCPLFRGLSGRPRHVQEVLGLRSASRSRFFEHRHGPLDEVDDLEGEEGTRQTGKG